MLCVGVGVRVGASGGRLTMGDRYVGKNDGMRCAADGRSSSDRGNLGRCVVPWPTAGTAWDTPGDGDLLLKRGKPGPLLPPFPPTQSRPPNTPIIR